MGSAAAPADFEAGGYFFGAPGALPRGHGVISGWSLGFGQAVEGVEEELTVDVNAGGRKDRKDAAIKSIHSGIINNVWHPIGI